MSFVGVLILTAALNSAAPEVEEFGVAVDIPTGSVIELTIEKDGEQTENGKTTTIGDMAFRYRQEIAATDEGYTVTQTFLDLQAPAEHKAAMEAAMAATRKITFDTDDRLVPVRVRDVGALLDAVMKPLPSEAPKTPEQLKAQEQALEMFKRTDPETLAAMLLREQTTAAAYQGIALPVGVELEAESETPNPFGRGPAIKQKLTTALTGFDESKRVAVIETNAAVDQDAFKAALPHIFSAMAPDASEPTPEDLANITFDRTNACRYEIDVDTGLASVTECTETKSAGDQTGARKSVTRTRITQKLIRPGA